MKCLRGGCGLEGLGWLLWGVAPAHQSKWHSWAHGEAGRACQTCAGVLGCPRSMLGWAGLGWGGWGGEDGAGRMEWGLPSVPLLKAVASFPGWIVKRRQRLWSIRFLEAISDPVVSEDVFSTPLSRMRI